MLLLCMAGHVCLYRLQIRLFSHADKGSNAKDRISFLHAAQNHDGSQQYSLEAAILNAAGAASRPKAGLAHQLELPASHPRSESPSSNTPEQGASAR